MPARRFAGAVGFPVDAGLRADAEALRRERDRKHRNRYPVTGREMRECGDIGELVLRALLFTTRLSWEWYRDELHRKVDFKIGAALVEVKTHSGNTEPLDGFTAGMAVVQADASPADFFCLARFDKTTDMLWILGAITKPRFFYYRQLYRGGEPIASSGAFTPEDKYEVPVETLTSLHTWFRQLKEWRP